MEGSYDQPNEDGYSPGEYARDSPAHYDQDEGYGNQDYAPEGEQETYDHLN